MQQDSTRICTGSLGFVDFVEAMQYRQHMTNAMLLAKLAYYKLKKQIPVHKPFLL